MKICAIRDEYRKLEIGILNYYEKSGLYLIEIAPDLKQEEAPVFFDRWLREGKRTVSPEWSRRFVESRIVPRDRQNLRSILHNAGLSEYDPFRLLMFSGGRCAQDDCTVREIREQPLWVLQRMGQWMTAASALKDFRLFLLFRDGTCRIVDMKNVLTGRKMMEILLSRAEDFRKVKIACGGRVLVWGEGQQCMYEELYQSGVQLPLSGDDMRQILLSQLQDVHDLAARRGVSKQYVSRTLQQHGVRELRRCGNSSLYLASDAESVFDK